MKKTYTTMYKMKLTHSEIIQILVALESYVIYWEKKGLEMNFTKELVTRFLEADEEMTNSPF